MTAKLRIAAIDRFIKGLKEDGIYDDVNACCVMAGWDGLAGALTPLKGVAPTNNGFIATDYDRGGIGITGDGTSYLDSSRDVGADSQDDAHISVHLTAASQTNGYVAGRASATFTLLGQNLGIRTSALYADAAIGTGTWALARNASNEFFYMQNSGTPQSLEVASGSPGTGNLHVFKYNPSGAATSNTLSFYSIGSSLGSDPATGLAALDARVSTLMSDLRAIEETGFDASALAYIRNVEEADNAFLETDVKIAINNLVSGLKSEGLWDAIGASCLLCGPRTLAGALVPLKGEYGPELVDIDNLPAPTTTVSSGGIPSYDAASRTMSCEVGSNNSFPRFFFDFGLTSGKRYRVRGRLSGDYTALYGSGVRTSNSSPYASIAADGTFDQVVSSDPFDGKTGSISFLFDSRSTPKSITIEELSIQEDSFTPTAYGFVEGDYDRLGLQGDGTSYLDSNRAVNADEDSSHHISAFVESGSGVLGQYAIGAMSTSSTYTIAGGGMYSRSNTSSAGLTSATFGIVGVSRSSPANFNWKRSGGATVTSVTAATPASISVSHLVFAYNTNTETPAGFATSTLAFYSIGSSLDLAKLDSHVSAYVTAIGAAV